MPDSLPVVAATLGVLLFMVLLWAAWVSEEEGEPAASRRLIGMAVLVIVVFLLPVWVPVQLGTVLAGVLLVSSLVLLLSVLLPLPGREFFDLGTPLPGVDERDIMFSRATLVPGTARFEEYYQARPENREPDDAFRKEPGLLQAGSAHYHRQGFAAADAAFWTIEMLRPFVDGLEPTASEEDLGRREGDGPPAHAQGVRHDANAELGKDGDPNAELGKDGDPNAKLGKDGGPGSNAEVGKDAEPDNTTVPFGLGGGIVDTVTPDPADPAAMSRFLKGWILKMGAHSAGVTELKDHHLYTHIGRGPDYGGVVDLDHPFALALTVEMDKEMVDRAPRAPTAMESAFQYLRCGTMAVSVANLIRRLGYRARAHVDGNYQVICPLVAKDAGLGELGRMGLLMTPRLGPRVRIAVVTTDLPLHVDAPEPDLTTIDFCRRCRKCADACPSRAISFSDAEEDEKGVRRWKIDAEACFTLWGKLGTDCARCMAVCPYSHPDNLLHNAVRWGIRNNALFRKGAVWMDDFVYGRRPTPKLGLEWMDVPEASKGPGP